MGKREVIQIAVDSGAGVRSSTLFALCDDGTIWRQDLLPNKSWRRMEDVPQDELPRETASPAPYPAEKSSDSAVAPYLKR